MSTIDFLEFHASHRPEAVALIESGRPVRYRRFFRDVLRFTSALAEFNIPRGSLAAVACDDMYLHWVLLLAWENLGVATASYKRNEFQDAIRPLLDSAAFVMSTHPVPVSKATRFQHITGAWVRGVLRSPIKVDREWRRHSPVGIDEWLRVRRSSGTTGGPKMMKISRRAEEQLVLSWQQVCGLTQSSRLLVNLDFAVASMYARATACIRLGATCLFERRVSMYRAIVEHQPTHVKLFQYQLPELLDQFEASGEKPAQVTAIIGSAPLSNLLRSRVMKLLATELVYTFNSNECGFIAVIGEDGVATLAPEVHVKLIDGEGVEVAKGEPGRICVRSPGLADGYIGNDLANKQMFRDGWFISGDAGTAINHRQFRLVGRSDDLLNIGGIKSEPSSIEEHVAEVEGVKDVGVTGIDGKDGVQEIGIAIVLKTGASFQKVEAAVMSLVARRYGRARVIAVQTIPRTEDSGKLQRNRLRPLFYDSMAGD